MLQRHAVGDTYLPHYFSDIFLDVLNLPKMANFLVQNSLEISFER